MAVAHRQVASIRNRTRHGWKSSWRQRMAAWAKLIGLVEHPDLAKCEIDTFRYRVLHVTARISPAAPPSS
jgi:hypothetical protein